MLRFYIVAGVVLVLAVTGFFMYEPFRLSYAIYKVRNTRDYYDSAYVPVADEYLMRCVQGAGQGHRGAMVLAVHHADVMTLDPQAEPSAFPRPQGKKSVGYVAAVAQPDLFLDLLSEKPEGRVRQTLWVLHCDLKGECVVTDDYCTPHGLVANFKEDAGSSDHRKARLAEACLNLVRHRFARELAAAEKRTAYEKRYALARSYLDRLTERQLAEKCVDCTWPEVKKLHSIAPRDWPYLRDEWNRCFRDLTSRNRARLQAIADCWGEIKEERALGLLAEAARRLKTTGVLSYAGKITGKQFTRSLAEKDPELDKKELADFFKWWKEYEPGWKAKMAARK
jgi:hypothetical protein